MAQPRSPATLPAAQPFPLDLVLAPESRRPTKLPDATIAAILAAEVGPAPSRSARTRAVKPQVSIVVVTMDNHVFLKLCLTSVLANTSSPRYELIVVDNGSRDGTAAYLQQLSSRHPHVTVIRNESNLGFAPANNQGLQVARGELLVLLNDDTVVPPKWLAHLCEHADDPSIGLLGPVTNRAGNESQIPTAYRTYGEFLKFARQRRASNRGQLLDVPMLTMFCLAMRREVYQRVGPLDEQFAVGMFEDDDYAMRVRDLGYRVVCVEDVFIHHFGATSLGKLAAAGELGLLFDANKRRFEEKWQTAWAPRRCRTTAEYGALVGRIRSGVGEHVPPGRQVAVVSRGDDELLDLAGRQACHFPQAADGAYAGHHPSDSAEALRDLSAVHAAGADYLLIPHTMRWWLDFYQEFAHHLSTHARIVVDNDAFVLFDLREAS
jgi:GT2 family glycosyltransferase